MGQRLSSHTTLATAYESVTNIFHDMKDKFLYKRSVNHSKYYRVSVYQQGYI